MEKYTCVSIVRVHLDMLNDKPLKECNGCFMWSNKYNSCRSYPTPNIINGKCMSKFIMKN